MKASDARPGAGPVARPGDMCDACGKEVPPGEGHREELAVASSMCPAPMAFHDECWAVASVMWEKEPESYCEVDPLYPETGRWLNLPEPEGPSA